MLAANQHQVGRLPSTLIRALLSAIYALDLDETAQLAALQEVWSHPAGGGEFAVTFSHRACAREVATLEHFIGAPALTQVAQQLQSSMSRDMRRAVLTSAPWAGAVSRWFPRSRALRRSREAGFPEFYGLMAPTRTGFTVSVGAPQPHGASAPTLPFEHLTPFAEHLAASWRLRKRLAAPDAFEHNSEAIFSPEGRAVDLMGSARAASVRERLRALVLARERAIGTSDLKLWPALLEGRYTIIDRFERSGRRFVVAYLNTCQALPAVRLGAQERLVLEAVATGKMAKVLAIELGLSQTRVSAVLHGALRKLGIASAIELTLLATSSSFVTLDDEVLGRDIVAAFALRGARGDRLLSLSSAERAVVADLLRGLSNREIAERRNRSLNTVANQVASILDKMQVPTRRALATALEM